MLEKPLIERLEENLFCSQETLPEKFTEKEFAMVKRFRWAFTKWLDNPTLSEKDLRLSLRNNFSISENTAYRDMPYILSLVGNVKNASKDFFRYKANYMINQAYKMNSEAETFLDVKQADVQIKAALAIVKINKLDKEDVLPHSWDDVKVGDYEITSDVSVLGLDPIAKSPDELERLKLKLRKKYSFVEKKVIDITPINEEKNISE